MGKDMLFDVPAEYGQELRETKKEGSAYRIVNGKVMGRLGNAAWFTNLEHSRRREELILYKRYNPEEYPKYDNYDAIEVSKTKEIPKDWDGAMGVPISFLDKYNPDQFEIVDINPHFFAHRKIFGKKPKQLRITGRKDPYARIIIKRRKLQP